MTPNILLERLKEFTEETTKDMILEVRVKSGETGPKERAAEVYTMRLPNKDAETKQIPYILLQFIKGADDQKEGEQPESECAVRFVFATYSEDGGKGAMDVLNLITSIRFAVIIKCGIVQQFSIKSTILYIVYPDSTPPYFMGEMMTLWEMPTIQREVPLYDELCAE